MAHFLGQALLALARQLRQRVHRRELHLDVDLARAHVERAAEDEREAEHVVDLVRVVAAAGGHDRVVAHGRDLGRRDLRVGVRHREDDRASAAMLLTMSLVTVPADETPTKQSAPRMASARLRAVGVARVALLVLVHAVGAALVDDALRVGHQHVLGPHAQVHVQVGAGDARRARARDHDLHVLDLALGQLERVQERRRRDDRGAVLVVVEDGDVHLRDQPLLDLEALRRADVLEVDPAEGRLEQLHRLDHELGVFGRELDVEHVDARKALEQDALALHHGLAGQRPEIAQPEHRGSVRHDRDQVPARGVLERVVGVLLDLEAGLGDPGRVGHREVARGEHALGRDDLDLPGLALLVVVERLLLGDQRAVLSQGEWLGGRGYHAGAGPQAGIAPGRNPRRVPGGSGREKTAPRVHGNVTPTCWGSLLRVPGLARRAKVGEERSDDIG